MTSLVEQPLRRQLVMAGAGLVLTSIAVRRVLAANEMQISMAGTASGSHVWFRPRGLWVSVGQAIRWVNDDAGNVHTVTAYHPANRKPLRIPESAKGWDSGYLMPGESFVWVFATPGVYDYFCLPHEHAGMVGRIVVGDKPAADPPYRATDSKLPEVALSSFPTVEDILKNIIVE
ncbi:MAG TPA: plastocyanin/azurin family copper-binding protein [Pusillimonas sp.]|uniref:cupredoxin domain-containing protein n=1 Tax=unclassified Pusillimonas TaxID=2640016 RepID=UPI00261FA500|nr:MULTISPECIES: plastocyanin/azurin family copper-binding protein [unclassified Pusillimonas]HLU19882.1 plastocyanin/azurin family copper-binding protein [Pusillimonas sp.]